MIQLYKLKDEIAKLFKPYTIIPLIFQKMKLNQLWNQKMEVIMFNFLLVRLEVTPLKQG